MTDGPVLFEPHQDDAVLFSAFTCRRFRPLVVTVLGSRLQHRRGTGITDVHRRSENARALALIGCTVEQWPFWDDEPDWPMVRRRMILLRGVGDGPAGVFAPAVEEGGHEQHNQVGELALEVFGDRVRPYLTYRRGEGRTVGTEIVPEPDWIAEKHRALACYASQIREPSTRSWFMDSLREYVP